MATIFFLETAENSRWLAIVFEKRFAMFGLIGYRDTGMGFTLERSTHRITTSTQSTIS